MISTHEELVLQAHQQFDALLALVEEAKGQRIDRFEGDVFGGLLGLGLTLVRLFVVQQGHGRRRTYARHGGRHLQAAGELTPAPLRLDFR